MRVTQDLSAAWRTYIGRAVTTSRFTAETDGPEGQWAAGDEIEAGLKPDADGVPDFHAYNHTTRRKIALTPITDRLSNGFTKLFNPYRLLRPGPNGPRTPGRQKDLSTQVDKCSYFCQNPAHPWSLLTKEPLLVTCQPNGYWAFYYNFSPFVASGHFVVVPVLMKGASFSLPHTEQKLTWEYLRDGIELGRHTEGLLIFFNGQHAGASQNHFHFQAVCTERLRLRATEETFAIERNELPTGSDYAFLADDYPINGVVFSPDAPIDLIHGFVQRMNEQSIPHNLILLRNKVYVVPRRIEHEIVDEFPYNVVASTEMAGEFIMPNLENYHETDYARVASALGKLSLGREEIEQLLGP